MPTKSCWKVDPRESEAHCWYTSFLEYLITISALANKQRITNANEQKKNIFSKNIILFILG